MIRGLTAWAVDPSVDIRMALRAREQRLTIGAGVESLCAAFGEKVLDVGHAGVRLVDGGRLDETSSPPCKRGGSPFSSSSSGCHVEELISQGKATPIWRFCHAAARGVIVQPVQEECKSTN